MAPSQSYSRRYWRVVCQPRPRVRRAPVRHVLYMVTLSASRANPVIRTFYTCLVARAQPEKVALVAAMHKLLTLLDAAMRDQTLWRMPPQTTPGT